MNIGLLAVDQPYLAVCSSRTSQSRRVLLDYYCRTSTIGSMTNEQLFEDLKQFIAATVTQQTSDVRGDIAQVKSDLAEVKGDIADVKRNVERLEKKVDDGFAGIATIIETVNTRTDDLEDGVNVRLTRLEHRAA